jgi:hypothetical protein
MPKLLALCFFAVLVSFEVADSRAKAPVNTIEYRIAPNGDAILVPIRAGHDLHYFLLDTGAAYNAIDPSLSRHLKMDSVIPMPQNPGRQLYASTGFKLDNTSIEVTGGFLVQDLAKIRAVSGQPISGVLGIEFLSGFRIVVDQDKGLLRLEQPSKVGLESGSPIEIDDLGRPTCLIELGNAENISFVIDTGMILPGLGEMEKSLFANLANRQVITPIGSVSKVQTVSESRSSRKGQVTKFQFGSDSFENLSIREGTFNGLGMDFLSRYNFALDIKNRRIWTSPSSRHRAPPLFDMSGLSIIKQDNEFLVVEVKPGSPAEHARIKTGDKVFGVNGQSKEVLSLHAIRLMLSKPNVDMPIEIFRESQRLPLVLPLRNWQNANLTLTP